MINTKRITFLGDSITDNGTYIAHINHYFFTHQIEGCEFINLGVSSETASGLSEPDHPFLRPCVHDRIDRALQLSKPDMVVVCYGMNDGIYYPFSKEKFEAYKDGITKLLDKIKEYGAGVVVMTPPPFDKYSINNKPLKEGAPKYSFLEPYENYTEVLRQYGKWILQELEGKVHKVIDIYTPLDRYIKECRNNDKGYIYGDGIHPNIDGHWVIAKTLLNELFSICLEREPKYLLEGEQNKAFKLTMERHRIFSAAWKEYVGHTNPFKAEALPIDEAIIVVKELDEKIESALKVERESNDTEISSWNGYIRRDFYVNGREAILIEPSEKADGCPWIWRTEFFDAFSYADMEMLKKGWCLAYYRISNQYGSPEAVEMMKDFKDYIVSKYSLSQKVVLFGFSRGGLYAFNYSNKYPKDVSVIYLDAPVLDIRSWPGGKGIGIGSKNDWRQCLEVYGLKEEAILSWEGASVSRGKALINEGIPVIIVAGDSDEVVPFEENGKLLIELFQELGGEIKLILKKGIGHHPHSLEDPKEIVDFILKNCD